MCRMRISKVYTLCVIFMLVLSPLASIFLMENDERVAGESPLEAMTTITNTYEGDNFGWNVSWAGDVNGDGFDDIVAGAPQTSAGNWWDSGWSYRRKLIFDNSGQSQDLVNFPVLINLSSLNFEYLNAKVDGTDLRFIDEDGNTELKYHIEEWNTSGNSYIWVNVTRIDAGSDTDFIWMYYGKSGALNVQDASGTYDTSYAGVWHLNETSGTHYDATSNDLDGSQSGGVTQDAQGKIDGADEFDGIDDVVTVTDSDTLTPPNNMTIEVWAKLNLLPSVLADDQTAVYKYHSNTPWLSYEIFFDDPSDEICFTWANSGGEYSYTGYTGAIAVDTWYYIVGVRDGSVARIYINGDTTSTYTAVAGNTGLNSDGSLYIGDNGATDDFNGTIDEVRLSNKARSPDWIRAQFLSMSSNFISYGAREEKTNDNGVAYIFFGHPGIGLTNIYTTQANVTIYGENPQDQFGWSVSGVGDVNSDGYDDIIVGAPGWNNDTGRAYLFYGRLSWDATYNASEADVIFKGENPGDRFGSSIAGITSQDEQADLKGWLYRKKIIIHASEVEGDFIDFPILIQLTDSDLRRNARTDGYDIMFIDLDGSTKLDHEVELWNKSSGELIAWVRAPFLDSKSDTILYIYYGNPNAPDQSNPNGVWRNGFVGVYHMVEETGDINNSASSTNDGTRINTPARNIGHIGYGQEFTGTGDDDYFNLGDLGITDGINENVTMSFWAWIDNTASEDRAKPICKRNNDDTESAYQIGFDNDPIDKKIEIEIEGFSASPIDVDKSSWVYIVGTYNGNVQELFINAMVMQSDTFITGPIANSNSNVTLGSRPASQHFGGILDEVRLSKVTRSEAWIGTEFNNQNDTSSFYLIGEEEIITENWLYRKPISISSSKVSGDLTDFPILVSITDVDLKNRARSDGHDIVFTGSDGRTRLDHEIESYDGGAGALIAWVRIPFLSSTSDLKIYLYYGRNNQIITMENPAGVWDNDYRLVQHLSETSGTHYDSTQYENHGTEYINAPGTQNASGKIDGADAFDGNNDYLQISDGPSLDISSNITIEMWLNPETLVDRVLLYKFQAYGMEIWFDGSFAGVIFKPAGGTETVGSGTDTMSAGTWNYIVFSYNKTSQNMSLFLNGNAVGSLSYSGDIRISGSDLFIASDDTPTNFYNGKMDELRISSIARSDAWINTSYNNQNISNSFCSVGNEEIIPTNWLYRKPITINSSQVKGDLTDYPMLISIIDSDLKSRARFDGYDIVFTERDGRTKLDHEIESYNITNGGLTAWVRIPYLSSTEDIQIYMHYGNPDAINMQNPHGVWDENFKVVQHLEEGGTGTRYDSSRFGNDGVTSGYEGDEPVAGKIDGADSFDGQDDCINMQDNPTFDFTDAVTYSFWRYNTEYFLTSFEIFRNNNPTISTWQGHMDVTMTFDSAGTVTADDIVNDIQEDRWYYISVQFNGTDILVYIDGELNNTYNVGLDTISLSNSDIILGLPNTNTIDGPMDEVRISDIARSSDWIKTEYSNQNDPSSFYTFGAEESFPQNWMFRKAITINISKITGDLTNFPVLVNTVDLDLKDKARSDGYDIVFSELDGMTRLDHEIENYNSSTGELVAWVKVPHISSSFPTIIYMHYGSPNQIHPTENPEDVWDDDYHAVWHLGESGDGTLNEFKESTSDNYHGQGGDGDPTETPQQTNGKIGFAQNFDGINDIIHFNPMNPISYNDFTFEAWYKSTELVIGPDQYIFAHMENGNSGPGSVLAITNDAGTEGYLRLSTRNSTQVYDAYYGVSDVHDQRYHHVVGVRESGVIKLYVDGELDNIQIDNHPGEIIFVNSSQTPTVGDYPFQNEEVNGTLDEIRVSRIARSWHWINASFSNQNDSSTFYSISPEEINPESWLYRKPITISSSQVVGDLNNFPVLIDIADSDVKSRARPDGYDIVFTKGDGRTRLDYEIESYNGSSGDLVAWIRIPILSSAMDTNIYMYYGNSDSPDLSNPEGVWDSNYMTVHHMEETSGMILDSTENNNDAVNFGAASITNGHMDGAYDFEDSEDDVMSASTSSTLNITGELTISAWINAETLGGYNMVVMKGLTGPNINNYYLSTGDDPTGDELLFGYYNGGYQELITTSSNIQTGIWYHVAAIYDDAGNNIDLYVNGVNQATVINFGNPESFSLPTNNNPLCIGSGSQTGQEEWDGLIDEVRISDAVRSPEWITTSFNNQNNSELFYGVGSEERTGGIVRNSILIGAYGYDNNRGRTYVFFGDSALLGDIPSSSADVIINGSAQGDLFGWDVSSAGDMDNDGSADLIIGAPRVNSNTGCAYIFFEYGSLPTSCEASDADIVLSGENIDDGFGFSVSDAGDLNDDGFDDAIIGAPGVDSGGIDRGRAYIYYGGSPPDITADMNLTGENDGDRFGFSVSSTGDLSGDGIPDVFVGAPCNDNGVITDSGAIYVFEGGPSMDSIVDWSYKGENVDEHLGWSVSYAGDLNGDGNLDISVGAPGNDDGGVNAGKIYLLNLPSFVLFEIMDISATPSIQFVNNYVNITCNVPSPIGIDEVWVNITYPDASYINVSMIPGMGDQWFYDMQFFIPGIYQYKIWANETTGNCTESGIFMFELLNNPPSLSSPQVNPAVGDTSTEFNFTVIYTDLDDHPPDVIVVNITGIGNFVLDEVDLLDTDYSDGKSYYYCGSGYGINSYSLHFAANDTFGLWIESGIIAFDVTNNDPTLTSEQVNPGIGYIDSWFNFSVIYTDLDNDAPVIITVNITGSGVYDLLELNPLDIVYSDGKEYYINLTGFVIGSYSVHFAANESAGNWTESGTIQYDVVSRNAFLTNGQVNPSSGTIDDFYNFTVTFTDLDGNPPGIISLNISGMGSYDLSESDLWDSDFTDGKEYFLNISGFSIGLYTFNFAAQDSYGNWTESEIIQLNVINRAPQLSSGQVNPLNGHFDDLFNFTVTYSDLDNHAPFVITVNISNYGILDLLEVDDLDLNYSDGKLYYINLSGFNVGLYTFHFAARDSLGLWGQETPEINSPNILQKQGILGTQNITYEFRDNINLSASLEDETGNPISGENIAFYVDLNSDGIFENFEFTGAGTTLSDGSISIIYSLHPSPGAYNLSIIFIGSANYVVEDCQGQLIINPRQASLSVVNSIAQEDGIAFLSAYLLDNESDPIFGEQVSFYLDKNKNGIYERGELIGANITSIDGNASITYTVDVSSEYYGILPKYEGSANYSVNEIEGLLTVRNIGDRPPSIAGTVPDQSKPEDSLPWPLDLTPYEDDQEDTGPDLKWYITGMDPNLYSVTGLNSSDDVITFIPIENAYGNDEVILWLWDSGGNRISQNLWINITPVNDLPHFYPQPPNLFVHYDDPGTYEDDPTPFEYTFYVNDVDNPINELTLTTSEPTTDSGRGYADVSGMNISYHYPKNMLNETILVTLILSDGTDSTQTVIAVTVTSDWIPEVIRKIPNVVLEENSTLMGAFDLDNYFMDKDNDSLYFSSGYRYLQVIINDDNSVDITALGHWTGSEFVTFRAEDPLGAIAEDMIIVTVIPVNDPPEISGVPDLVVHYDYSYAFDLSPYITDTDNLTTELEVWTSEPLTYISLQPLNPLGIVITYPESMNGMTIPVTIFVSDGLERASQHIQVRVTDDFPPEMKYPLPDVFFEEDSYLNSAFTLSHFFFDVDDDILFYSNGSTFVNVTINNDLTVDFTAPTNWSGSEYVTFRATDSSGALAEDKILVMVIPVNDPPTMDVIPRQNRSMGDQWILDLSEYIHDIDTDESDLVITVESQAGSDYITLVGNILIFRYPNDVSEDIVRVTISDGEYNASRNFVVSLTSSKPLAPSIWDMIPWNLVFLFFIVSLGCAYAVHRRRSRYDVYEAFLIHEEGLPIAHASRQDISELEDVMVSGMFTAVQDFINDAFSEMSTDDDWELNEMKFGDHKILIERAPYLYLAVIFEGSAKKLRHRVKKILNDINSEYGDLLKEWDGDETSLVGIRDMIWHLIPDKARGSPVSEDTTIQLTEDSIPEDFEGALIISRDKNEVEIKEDASKYIGSIERAPKEDFGLKEIEVYECPVCGKEIYSYDPECPRCGVRFDNVAMLIGSDSDKKKEIFECPNCKVEITENAGSCPNCGVKFIENTD